MQRRKFNKLVFTAAAGAIVSPVLSNSNVMKNNSVRLGGPIFEKYNNPDEWVKAIKKKGFRAAYCPVGINESTDVIKSYKKAANEADIIIAEVGAWSNPIDPDNIKADEAMKKCINSLVLAEEIGASCCVNISGSRNPEKWAGPHKDNLTADTFDLIVESTRKIIDAVKPKETFYALETMPWAYPDSVESYVRLIKAIDRKGFAVHFDPVNLVVSPQVYYNNGAMIKEAFRKLGQYMKSCHAKDILLLDDQLTPHLAEVRAGLGNLNYKVFLSELAQLGDLPIMLEHLNTEEEYNKAADFIRNVGKENNISFGEE